MNLVTPLDRKFLCQHRNGDDFLTLPVTDFVPYMQGAIVEKLKLIAEYDVSTIVFSDAEVQISATDEGAQIRIHHPFLDWSNEGLVVGDTIRVEANGLFVNETTKNIENICRYCGLNAVQLHGNEPPGSLDKLRHYKVIKAFRIKNEKDIVPINKYKPDAVLLDGYAENKMGGTGASFDWQIVKKLKTSRPVIIAGGLTHLNVLRAIKIARPYGVDVSSGVEIKPGKKDRKLIKKFIDAVKG